MMIDSKPTITDLKAAVDAANMQAKAVEDDLGKTDGLASASDLETAYADRARAQARLAAAMNTPALITSSITMARGAIEWIATTILAREIAGLVMAGPDVDFEQWTSAGPEGRLRAEWRGLAGHDLLDAAIVVTPEHHSEGFVTLDIVVSFERWALFPDMALTQAKLYLAIAELAKEIADPWTDRALTLG